LQNEPEPAKLGSLRKSALDRRDEYGTQEKPT
jgi:hypothetical protein